MLALQIYENGMHPSREHKYRLLQCLILIENSGFERIFPVIKILITGISLEKTVA